MLVTQDYTGRVQVELKLHVAQNGLTEEVEVLHATNREVGDRIAAMARNWIFIPYEKDGVMRPTVTNVKLQVQAIKSQ